MSQTGGWCASTDALGFSALSAGCRGIDGIFNIDNYNGYAYFWSASQYSDNNAYFLVLDGDGPQVSMYSANKNYGYSVRCIKDEE